MRRGRETGGCCRPTPGESSDGSSLAAFRDIRFTGAATWRRMPAFVGLMRPLIHINAALHLRHSVVLVEE
jgi:hypothetical protein